MSSVPIPKPAASKKPWVDPTALPPSTYTAAQLPHVRGNAPHFAVRQALDTFAFYGARSGAGFGAAVSERVKFLRADVHCEDDDTPSSSELQAFDESLAPRKPASVTVTAEIIVDEGTPQLPSFQTDSRRYL